jgi:pimeloyl-ACP methyl ester carboxylesterase
MFLASRFEALGVEFQCPDLNLPEFSTMTITRMIAQVEQEILAVPRGPIVLIGSSLGAFVALHVTSRAKDRANHPIERLVLLAPAVEVDLRADHRIGPQVTSWRDTNRLDVFHYAFGEMRHLEYAMFEDAERYKSVPIQVDVPILIVQGRRDDTIDPAVVEAFAAARPNVTLKLVDDGHQLTESVDGIWRDVSSFMGLRG